MLVGALKTKRQMRFMREWDVMMGLKLKNLATGRYVSFMLVFFIGFNNAPCLVLRRNVPFVPCPRKSKVRAKMPPV